MKEKQRVYLKKHKKGQAEESMRERTSRCQTPDRLVELEQHEKFRAGWGMLLALYVTLCQCRAALFLALHVEPDN